MISDRGSKILVIGGYAHSLTNFRGALLRAIKIAGHQVVAVAPGISLDPNAKAELGRSGISCRDVPLSRTGLNPLADFRTLVALFRLIRHEKPEAILAYTAKPVIFGMAAAAMARVPRRYALITGLGYGFTGGGGTLRRIVRAVLMQLYRTALARTTRIVFQNPDDAALFKSLGLVPPDLPVIIVNGSGVDVQEFRPASLPAPPIRFLLIARMLSAKGIREFVTAARQLRLAGSAAEFHLVGGIDSNPDAIPVEEIRRWQREDGIVWQGEVADVRPYIAASHVFVLPSYREGTPRSVLEAMAMARPVITCDAPGCRETVVDGVNGFLVPPRSVEVLVRAMNRFIEDPALCNTMGRRSRELAEAKYDVESVNAQMLSAMELD